MGPDSASGEYILFQSRLRQCQPERETPLTPAPSCEEKSAASVAFWRERKQSNTVKTVSVPWECPWECAPPPHTHTPPNTHTLLWLLLWELSIFYSPLGGVDARQTPDTGLRFGQMEHIFRQADPLCPPTPPILPPAPLVYPLSALDCTNVMPDKVLNVSTCE